MTYTIIYLAAIILANLSVAYFGPASTPVNAFLFIGLDLTLRDKLHDSWSGSGYLATRMGALIMTGGVLTFLVAPGTQSIVIASVVAFSVAATLDAVAYHALKGKTDSVRVNTSNAFGAAADSVIFPTLAFGVFMPWVILAQFAAKVLGGFVWFRLLRSRVFAVAALLLFLAVPAQAQTSIIASAHYDVAREAPIAAVVYTKPMKRVFVTGFVETWKNNKTGFPGGEWSVFSKHWISKGITPRLSFSVEVELLYNRAGVAFTFPRPVDYRYGNPRLHVTPKIGLSYRLK